MYVAVDVKAVMIRLQRAAGRGADGLLRGGAVQGHGWSHYNVGVVKRLFTHLWRS